MKHPSTRQCLSITAASFLAFAILACSQLGLAPAENLEQKIAYAYGTNTGVRNAAASALENGRLGKSEAVAVLEITNQVRSLLDASKAALGAGDVATAEGRLTLAVSLLTALQSRLNAQPRSPS